jgi:hypothetical protein
MVRSLSALSVPGINVTFTSIFCSAEKTRRAFFEISTTLSAVRGIDGQTNLPSCT